MEFVLTLLIQIVPVVLSIALLGSCLVILFDLFFLYRKRLAALDYLSQSISRDIASNHGGDLNINVIKDAKKRFTYEEDLRAIAKLPAIVHYAKHYWFSLLLALIAVHFLILKSDVDFPLYMVIAVLGSGLIGLYDICLLKKKRQAVISRIESQLGLSEQNVVGVKDDKTSNQSELLADLSEPVEVGYAKSFFPVLLVVLVLRSFIVEPFQIPSASMVPSLEIGDFILVNKYTYGIRLPVIRNKVIAVNNPERGDVMVFFPPHQKRYFIKRVVGLPGDEINYVNNVLYINGKKMPQTLVAALPPSQPTSLVMKEDLDGFNHLMKKNIVPGPLSHNFSAVVPEGHYFMIGDNRDNSSDSRDWGAVPEENIVGKAFAIWMHWDNFFSIPSFSRAGAIQ